MSILQAVDDNKVLSILKYGKKKKLGKGESMGYRQYEPEILKKIQEEELKVIKEFVRICDKYQIRYFAVFGTAIGAVRHQGFIPWDDDVDFGMLRKDYEKFKKVAPKEFGGKYALAGPDCKQKYYNFVSKMYKKGTRFATNYDHGNFEMGINIDIFVFDYLAEGERERRWQMRKALALRSLYMTKNVNFFTSSVFTEGNFIPRLICGVLYYVWKIIPCTNAWLCGKWKANAIKYGGTSEVVTQFNDTGIWESRIHMDDLFPLVEVPFEDIHVKLPKNYDKVLREMYGDYMQLPPKEKRQNHYPYLLQFEGEEERYGTSV